MYDTSKGAYYQWVQTVGSCFFFSCRFFFKKKCKKLIHPLPKKEQSCEVSSGSDNNWSSYHVDKRMFRDNRRYNKNTPRFAKGKEHLEKYIYQADQGANFSWVKFRNNQFPWSQYLKGHLGGSYLVNLILALSLEK